MGFKTGVRPTIGFLSTWSVYVVTSIDRELLETTDLSILQVALNVGFLESAQFIRTFQLEVGMTPRAYRRSAKG